MTADWQNDAACAGMSSALFFPSSPSSNENARLAAAAREVCGDCPVSRECGEFARKSNDGRRERFGIWNGVNHEKVTSNYWDLTCRYCLNDFEAPSSSHSPPWYCSEKCREAAGVKARIERQRRYRGNPQMQAVGL